MNSNDFNSQSILYTTLVNKVESSIKKLKSIGLKTELFEIKLNNIKNNTFNQSGNNQIISRNEVKNNNNNQLDSINNKITELRNLIKELSDYEEYYIISRKGKYIIEQVDNNEIFNFDFLMKEAESLLDRMESIKIGNYEIQEDVISKTYEAIYSILKLESIYRPNVLLSRIKSNEVHSYYISKLIEDECKSSSNEKVKEKYLYLDANGLDSKELIDSELLRLLTVFSDKNYINKMKTKTLEDYNKYKNALNELKYTAGSLETSVKNYEVERKNIDKNFFKLLRRASVFGACLGITGMLTINANKWMNSLDDLYYTHSIEHNLETGEITTSDNWESLHKKNIVVVEERPWELYDEDDEEYYKVTYYYRLDQIKEDEDLNNYVKIVQQKGHYNTYDKEFSKEKPENFGNEENKYKVIIKEYTSEYVDGDEDGICFIFSILIFTILSLISILIYLIAFSTDKPITDIIDTMDDIARGLHELPEDEIQENIKLLYELIDTCNKLQSILKENPCYEELCPEIDSILEEINAKNVLDKYAPNTNKELVLRAKH